MVKHHTQHRLHHEVARQGDDKADEDVFEDTLCLGETLGIAVAGEEEYARVGKECNSDDGRDAEEEVDDVLDQFDEIAQAAGSGYSDV